MTCGDYRGKEGRGAGCPDLKLILCHRCTSSPVVMQASNCDHTQLHVRGKFSAWSGGRNECSFSTTAYVQVQFPVANCRMEGFGSHTRVIVAQASTLTHEICFMCFHTEYCRFMRTIPAVSSRFPFARLMACSAVCNCNGSTHDHACTHGYDAIY